MRGQRRAGSRRTCLVIGQTNAGKTLFTINFAAWLGYRVLDWAEEAPMPEPMPPRRLTPDQARAEFVSEQPFSTRAAVRVGIELVKGKGKVPVYLVDTAGLTDAVHPDPGVRAGMAGALSHLLAAHLVLHMIDAALVGVRGLATAVGQVDFQICRYARRRGAYAILANKMDLPGAREGLGEIRETFREDPVLPVSARGCDGFREVLAFARRNL